MYAVADLPTMAGGHSGGNTPLREIAFQHIVNQHFLLDLLKSRFRHPLFHGSRNWNWHEIPAHRVRDIFRLRKKIRAADEFSGKGKDVAAASQPEVEPYVSVLIDLERRRPFLTVGSVVPQIVSFLHGRTVPQPLQESLQRQLPHLIYRHINLSVDDKFDAYPVLRVEMPRRAAPQAALADVYRKSDTVGEVGFHFERHRPAVDERIPARKARAVEQHLVAPIHRFISGKRRTAYIEEKNLSGVGEKVVVETSLGRELYRRNPRLLVGVVALQILAAEDPLVAAFGVGREHRTDVVARIVAAGVRVEPVGHAAPKLDAPHLGEASLRVGLPDEQGKRRDEKKPKPLHGYCTLSSLMTLARTRSSFSTMND